MTDYLGNLGILIEFMSEIVHLVISYNFIAMNFFFVCVCLVCLLCLGTIKLPLTIHSIISIHFERNYSCCFFLRDSFKELSVIVKLRHTTHVADL